jgi:8-oxo-dGTP diphosphatase
MDLMPVSSLKPRVRVVAGLFCRGQRVLVQQRPKHKPRGLLWEFPGGKVELGETDAEALQRECEEELAVKVEVAGELWRTLHDYADLVVELVLLEAKMPENIQPEPLDAYRLAWVEVEGLSTLDFCEADRDLVAGLVTGAIPLGRV